MSGCGDAWDGGLLLEGDRSNAIECSNCRYFRAVPEAEDTVVTGCNPGECRRFPPKTTMSDDEWMTTYAIVSGDMWCGEFQRHAH